MSCHSCFVSRSLALALVLVSLSLDQPQRAMGSPQHYSALLKNVAKAGSHSATSGVAWRALATTPPANRAQATDASTDALTEAAAQAWGVQVHTVAPGEPFVFNHAEAMKIPCNQVGRWWGEIAVHKRQPPPP
jgi:hypothetical protein